MTRAIIVFLVLSLSSPALAEFVGTLGFKPADCKAAGQCELVYDFGYIDPTALRDALSRAAHGQNINAPGLMRIVALESWLRTLDRSSIVAIAANE